MTTRDITAIKKYVKEKMSGEATGHDWYHVLRVFTTAKFIASKEKNVNVYLVQAAALMHDLGDWKVRNSDKTQEEIVAAACKTLALSREDSSAIIEIIVNMSYSKNVGGKKKLTLEGKIVQDADRLDALGAIGIARAFAYGGKHERLLFDPTVKPKMYTSTEEYRKARSSSINHFYEKLFKLKRLMNTPTAKSIAIEREKFMKAYLREFFAEWKGKA